MEYNDLIREIKLFETTQLFRASVDSLEKLLSNKLLDNKDEIRLCNAADYIAEMSYNSPVCGKTGLDCTTMTKLRPVFFKRFIEYLPSERLEDLRSRKINVSDYILDYSLRAYTTFNSAGKDRLLEVDELKMTKEIFSSIANTLLAQLNSPDGQI